MEAPRIEPVQPRVIAPVGRNPRRSSGGRDFADELERDEQPGESVDADAHGEERDSRAVYHAPGEAGEHLDLTA